ncbi:hypothetical protein MFRU_006g02030 [Monilinia fructicola]|uniref:2EXR domain-containing protein n=1 Tax=Monilinia fructicola TaxID=38448 RepID=A0A5M9JAK8_MONFR|nr:hypothetical protein EYC84_009472 [Monilinia fructicola]KAG4032739.1 hypothetical protein MFRU_006g02030 [Monilinia fructicola]
MGSLNTSSLSSPADASASKRPLASAQKVTNVENDRTQDSGTVDAPKVDEGFPQEVWDAIWRIVANNNPRNVDIWAWSVGHKLFWDSPHDQNIGDPWQHGDADQWEPFRFMTTQIVPPILHVNTRSRAIALEYYKLSFGVRIPTLVGEYRVEPRIYYHIRNDCICPMGRFDYNSVRCFWEALPEGAAAMALNLCSFPYNGKESEEDGNKINRDEFGDEDWRGTDGCPQPFERMMAPHNLVNGVLEKVEKVYLYNYTDYFCKRGPRDFRFIPFVKNPELKEATYTEGQTIRHLTVLKDSDHRTAYRLWKASERIPSTLEYDNLYKKWVKWLKYGGLDWIQNGGPKPSEVRISDNVKEYSWQRKKFFQELQSWEEQQFINRGDPAIEANGP